MVRKLSQMLLLSCLWLLLSPARGQSTGSKSIHLKNTGSTPVTEAVVSIPWATVQAAYPRIDTSRLRVVALPDNREVPYQLERRGGRVVQNLLVQVSVGAGQTLRLGLQPERPAPVSPRTYCRYVPERKDDFAWENDRIAFRIYGQALESTKENAYGNDIWAKRTNRLVLNDWYRQNDYHTDHGEGLDYYHVGFTLGAGNVGIYLGDTISYFRNYRSWRVLDNGPLRSTFQVTYAPQRFGKETVMLTKIISIDAGSQLSKIELLTESTAAELPIVAGITLRPEGGSLTTNEPGILSYWEPRHGDDGTMGVGCLVPNSANLVEAHRHGLARFTIRSGQPLTYYAGGAWDKATPGTAGRIQSAAAWLAYLRQFASQLRQPLTITLATR